MVKLISMKKIILAFILSLAVIFSLAKDAKADCINKGFFGCDSSHTNSCGDGNTCCFTAGECGQYPADPCSYACRVPGTPTCIACQNSKGKSIPGSDRTSADIQGKCGDKSIDTAIGCIPILNDDGGTALMGFLLKWAIGIGGGIAFLLILYAGFMIMTAAGNPERLKAGQELMTSAISGLVLLIFSIFVLKFIGLDILGLGQFGFGK